MENLDLYWSCIKNDDRYINEEKLYRLLKSMRETLLKANLEKLHICAEDYAKEDIEEMLTQEHFEIELKIDSVQPHPYE